MAMSSAPTTAPGSSRRRTSASAARSRTCTIRYGVLQSPNGTNEATYTYADGWQGVGSTTIPIAVIDNSTLVVVSVGSFLGLGYALEVLPYGSGAPVNGFTSL